MIFKRRGLIDFKIIVRKIRTRDLISQSNRCIFTMECVYVVNDKKKGRGHLTSRSFFKNIFPVVTVSVIL